jgi:hypothetical protein
MCWGGPLIVLASVLVAQLSNNTKKQAIVSFREAKSEVSL